jgi:hypothetical protein
MKLRILSIGLELEHDEIVNADLVSAPSFHDFDVVLIDPLNVVDLLFLKHKHEIKDGFLTLEWDAEGTNKRIKNTMSQRREELIQFLGLQRLLVCILRRPISAYLCIRRNEWPKPDETDNWASNYDWFPMRRSSDSVISMLRIADGSIIKLVDPKHPFAPYLKAFGNRLCYEAYLEEHIETYYFKEPKIFARTHGQLSVGFSFKTLRGQVVFLPTLTDRPDPKKLTDVLLDCISATTSTIEETTPPSWVSDYKVFLPNLSDLEGETEKLHNKISELHERLNNIEQQKAEQQKYLKLLYEQGKFQLEPVVRDAFSLFGFTVKEAEPSDGLLESNEGTALLEVEGKDNTQISRDKYRQLLDHVDDDERQTGQLKKGILVGNGFRLIDPKERDKQFTRSAMEAASGSHFCLIPTDTLFNLVCKVLTDPDNEGMKSKIRKQILSTDGLFV